MRTALAVMRREKQKAAFGLKATYYSDGKMNKLWCELLLVSVPEVSPLSSNRKLPGGGEVRN